MANVKEQVETLVKPIIENMGLELVEVEYAKKNNGMNLTIFIDKKGGVTLDDCEMVHSAIDEPLDKLDPTNNASYILNVSSPGLDRPIKTDKDFERNIGEVIEITTFKKIGLKKDFVGQLKEFTSDDVTIIDKKGKEMKIDRKLISKATKYIEF